MNYKLVVHFVHTIHISRKNLVSLYVPWLVPKRPNKTQNTAKTVLLLEDMYVSVIAVKITQNDVFEIRAS